MDLLLISLIFSIVMLLLMSFFFSGAETSLTTVSSSRIHKLKLQGNKKAEIIEYLSKKKELVIGTILLGNTIVNIASSSLSTAFFIKIMGDEGVIVSTITMTLLILLFAEMLPKTYAIQNPEKVALFSSKIMLAFVHVLSPITISIQFAVNCLLKICRLHKTREVISAADVMRNLILLHKSEGTMLRQDLDMLNNILDLAETEISQVMTHRKNLFALNIDQNINDLIKQIINSSHSRIPLWKNHEDNIIGLIHVRDIINELREKTHDLAHIDLQRIMHKPWFIPSTTLLSVQLHNFRKRRKHFAFVIDEYGTLQGIVTLEDILEEIVGDISDEHDIIVDNLINNIGNNIYHINGEMPVRDINRQLRWDLPDEEASTLAGIIVHEIERIPDEGEEFSLYGFHFKILKKTGNIINIIEVNTADKTITI